MEDTILYPSCFDANGGLFETLLTAEDAVLSDRLNHASIIDGVRLCKATRYRYNNNDMRDLEEKLKQADEKGARIKLIATDAVFSMDGIIADLQGICDLAEKYDAVVMVDDCHGLESLGLNLIPGQHPIVPVMLGDAALAQKVAACLLEKGLYVVGFSYPVVPRGEARIRTQVSAGHLREDLDFALEQFREVKDAFDL